MCVPKPAPGEPPVLHTSVFSALRNGGGDSPVPGLGTCALEHVLVETLEPLMLML